MAKITGPLLSLGASGQIGKTLVYSVWRGVKYVRQLVTPENPNTTEQVKTRSLFSWLVDAWKLAPTLVVSPWDTHALGRPFTGRNAFIGQNISVMRGDTNLDDLVGSPGARGGLPPDTFAAATGVALITCTFSNPAVPTGWTLVAAIAACLPDNDPQAALIGVWVAAEDTSDPFDTVVLTGLDTVLYRVVGWLEWLKPDGRTAYSVSLTDSATPT